MSGVRRTVTARRSWCAAFLVASLVIGACGVDGTGGATGDRRRTLVVAVAASLAAPVERVATRLEAERPGLEVQLNPAASSTLARQIAEGSPAGVFISAGPGPMAAIGDRAVDPRVVAADDLVLAVPAGNPGSVRTTADLSRPGLRVGWCAPGVPCGEYARTMVGQAGVAPSVDTEEPDAGSLLAKVRARELDVAVLYRAQVLAAAPDVEVVEPDPPSDVRVEYLIAALRGPDGSAPTDDAVAFVDRAGDDLSG